jgi:hypothetical protein
MARGSNPSAKGLGAALGFQLGKGSKGRANPFKSRIQRSHEVSVAFHVYQAHTKRWSDQKKGLCGTPDWGSIFGEVAQSQKLSVGTVKRFWYRHAFKVIPPHLIDKAASQNIDDILR